MISKKYISELFTHWMNEKEINPKDKTIEDFFDYVIESEINGNYNQVKEFVKEMSQNQHSHFMIYICNNKALLGERGMKSLFLK